MTPTTEPTTEERSEGRPADPIDAVVETIKADAERAPESYAKETIVPEGGE